MHSFRLFVCLLCLLVLAGCWDSKEIEEIGFILGVALDPIKNHDEEEQDTMTERDVEIGKHQHDKMFRVTYQLAIPQNLQIGVRRGTDSYTNITSTGMSNLKISRNTSTRSSRLNNSEHLQVLIIHEQLAREGMIEHLVDFFLRDHEMRRRVHVLIAKESASSMLEKEIDQEPIPAIAIRRTHENYQQALQMLKYIEIGELTAKLVRSESYILPRISSYGEDDFKIAGAAIFNGKTNKMVGWLGETDIEGYNWIEEEANNGVLEVELENKANFIFEVFTMSSKVTYKPQEKKDHFHIAIMVEGTFGESWLHDIDLDNKAIEKLEKTIEEKVKQQITAILIKMQQEYHLDIFGFGQKIKRKNFTYWEEIKDHWDGADGGFQQASFSIDVKAKIRNYMTKEKLQ